MDAVGHQALTSLVVLFFLSWLLAAAARSDLEILADLAQAFGLTIASQERAMALAEGLAPILTSHGLLLSMWGVEVIPENDSNA